MSKLKAFYQENTLECGIDEAGAGPLAGPVAAGAVIWPPDLSIKEDEEWYYEFCLLRDSKKLSEKQRNIVKEFIKYHALDYAVAFVDNNKIDEINIRNARILAMHNAISKLQIVPEFLLVDGDAWQEYTEGEEDCIKSITVVNGDNKYQSIAAASILAKCARDEYVINTMHKEYPNYGWDTNKGYGTQKHYDSLRKYGKTPYHRMSFNLKLKQECLIDDDESE